MICHWLAAAMLFVTASGSSQIGRLWTFSDLVGESDFVVIGKAVGARDTGRKATHPELRPALPVIELETDVQVLAVLKRDATVSAEDARRLVLHHYRLDMDEWRRQHPPATGQPPPGLVNAGEAITLKPGEDTCLFFLKRGARGWEPATGHTFPNQSVFPLVGAQRVGGGIERRTFTSTGHAFAWRRAADRGEGQTREGHLHQSSSLRRAGH